MSNKKTIEAWKDQDTYLSLSAEERAALPPNPAGLVELTDEALDDLVAGVEDGDTCCWDSCGGGGGTPIDHEV